MTMKYFLYAFFSLFLSIRLGAQTNETLSSGAYIVNMGVSPQTIANGLKPYGLLYDLVSNYAVPVKWVINGSKVKDGIDFSYNGIDYRGGPFIIPAEYRSASVDSRIAYWNAQGVVGVTTTSPITVPVMTTIKAAPRWTLDQQNGSIAVLFFANAGIPPTAHGGTSSSNWKLPSQLTCCDDIFVMPHADPTWATHQRLMSWNLDCDGAIWTACHAGSALADMFNPANPSEQTNFLNEKTGVASGAGPYSENALILWGNHSSGTLPYSYGAPTACEMQFLGTLDAATQNGSEQIYIPTSAGWRASTTVGVWDPDHPQIFSANPQHRAAVVAFGRAFGDENRGRVMLEAAHSIAKATLPSNVAAQRVFFNWSFLTANQEAITPDISSLPDTLSSGSPTTLTYSLPVGASPSSYTTSWSVSCGGTFSPNSTQQTVTFTPGVVSGSTPCLLTVQITDACGRAFKSSKAVILKCAISATPTVTNVICNGASTGVISMAVTGGSGPYTYNWSRVSPAGTGSGSGTTISGLSAGTYNVTLTSSNGCNVVFSSTISQPAAALAASSSLTNILCNGAATGAINLTASGGTSPYTYNWGSGVTSEDRSGLAAGSYSVVVTDANACTTSHNATLTQPASALDVSATPTNVNCFGASTGAITITATGGTSPYTYNWGSGITTQNRSSLAAGTYSVTVTDANNCTKTSSINITQPAAALGTSTAVGNVVCGVGSGSVSLTVSGGTSPYAYAWNSGATTQNRTGLSSGTYTVTVTDANLCTVTASATVTATTNPSFSTSVTNVACNGGSTGAINLTVSAGTSPYSYLWSNGMTTEDLSSRAAGTYSVTVTDAIGCKNNTSATIAQPAAALSVSGISTDVSCNGGATGSINITASGGTTPYSYLWTGVVTTEDRSSIGAGAYSVTVTDANSCTATANFTIAQPTTLTISSAITQATCPSATDAAINITAAGGTAPYNYDWADIAGTNNIEDRTALATGTYSVTVTDAAGCTVTISITIVSLNPNPPAPGSVSH